MDEPGDSFFSAMLTVVTLEQWVFSLNTEDRGRGEFWGGEFNNDDTRLPHCLSHECCGCAMALQIGRVVMHPHRSSKTDRNQPNDDHEMATNRIQVEYGFPPGDGSLVTRSEMGHVLAGDLVDLVEQSTPMNSIEATSAELNERPLTPILDVFDQNGPTSILGFHHTKELILVGGESGEGYRIIGMGGVSKESLRIS